MKKIVRPCPQCGIEFSGRQTKVYCSPACRAQAPRIPWNKGREGIKANRPRNGVERPCEHCGLTFYTPANKVEARFCSMACYVASRWGDRHREMRACVVCGTQFECRISDDRTCCSAKCRTERKSALRAGERSEFWRGGKMAPYHSDWKPARRAALERDGYKCALCGSDDRIQVHHITPYRYARTHALANLVTLCRPCHSREELKVNPAAKAGLLQRWPQQSDAD